MYKSRGSYGLSFEVTNYPQIIGMHPFTIVSDVSMSRTSPMIYVSMSHTSPMIYVSCPFSIQNKNFEVSFCFHNYPPAMMGQYRTRSKIFLDSVYKESSLLQLGPCKTRPSATGRVCQNKSHRDMMGSRQKGLS